MDDPQSWKILIDREGLRQEIAGFGMYVIYALALAFLAPALGATWGEILACLVLYLLVAGTVAAINLAIAYLKAYRLGSAGAEGRSGRASHSPPRLDRTS